MARPPLVSPEAVPAAIAGDVTRPPRHTAWKEYWLSVLAVCAVVFAWMTVRLGAGDTTREVTVVTVLLFALVFPAIQLAASVVALVALSISKAPGHEVRIQHLG